jgi:hypothetical protein
VPRAILESDALDHAAWAHTLRNASPSPASDEDPRWGRATAASARKVRPRARVRSRSLDSGAPLLPPPFIGLDGPIVVSPTATEPVARKMFPGAVANNAYHSRKFE